MTLPLGSTLVLVLCASDATHLTNVSVNGKVWAVYVCIGNLRSSFRHKATAHTWVLVAISPNGTKRINKVPEWWDDQQQHEAMQVLGYLVKCIISSLSTSVRDAHDIKCGDEVVRNCYFRDPAWLADQFENSAIHSIYAAWCAKCEAPRDRIGELQKYPLRYTQWYQDGSTNHKQRVCT